MTMKSVALNLLAFLCLYGSVSCGIFDDIPTVMKARCYANCITLTSKITENDTRCQSTECQECKSPCDVTFTNLTSCNNTCNSRICEESCTFIDSVRKWPSIYEGNTTITAPEVITVKSKNISSLELSWQPSIAQNGSAVYLLKVTYEGDYNTGPHLMKDIVFIDAMATVNATQACAFAVTLRLTYDGIDFNFSVVALSESSNLVEANFTANFVKGDAVESIYNPIAIYEETIWDDLRLQVSFNPPSALMGKNVKYLMQTKATPVSKIGVSRTNSLITDKPANISVHIFQKTPRTYISIKIYSMMECLPSKPKELIYFYRGCHNVSNYDKTQCCKFDANLVNAPSNTRQVRNLTYTPLQVTNDFRFNTSLTWQPPTHSCPAVSKYFIAHEDKNKVRKFVNVIWFAKTDDTTNTFFPISNIKPGIEYKVEVVPGFGKLINVGVKRTLYFKTPDVPRSNVSIRTIQHSVASFSQADLFIINITWSKPAFKYSSITAYNVTYTLQGHALKHNRTSNLWFAVGGLDFNQILTYQVIPMYRDSWIQPDVIEGKPVKIEPSDRLLQITNLKSSGFTENQELNLFTVDFTWSHPKFAKPIDYYSIRYSLKGYLRIELDCPSNGKIQRSCLASKTVTTNYSISKILPNERIEFSVTPVYANTKFVTGLEVKASPIRAPGPRDNLVKVQNLNSTEISSFKYNITWVKPLFTHSAVKYYDVSTEIFSSSNSARKRRSTIKVKNVTTNHYITPGVEKGKQLTVKVTPQFEDQLIVGKTAELRLGGPPIGTHRTSGISRGETIGLVIGILVLVAVVLVIIMCILRSTRQEEINEGRVVDRKKGAVIDQWEVFRDKLLLDDVIGQGAFGKVYKGTLVELPEQSSKYTSNLSIRRRSTMRKSIKEDNGYTVAVKMLQDMADEEQRREFLKEIQLMKDVGSHRNIVNMLGCGTLSDPMFLIVEYLPNLDLLHYLRKRRRNVHQYPDSDPRGPYHSTYCQTYFNRNKTALVAPVQELNKTDKTSESPFYTYFNKLVNRGFQDDDGGDVQLVSIQSGPKSDEFSKDDDVTYDDEDDTITSGDLMAFAWQVSQGMEFLTKRGYVHRDLAARNVLVGENKEAKIADFGLTRHTYNSLYTAKTNRRLPIKWMSIEAIFDNIFTEKSDVWAYGVFLWELVTLGGTPYPTKSIRELLKALKEGYRMEKPDTCDNEIYGIMLCCWEEKQEDRPTFTKIRNKLEEMMMRDNPYFDPSSVDETRDYYNVPSFHSIQDDSEGLEDEVFDEIFGDKKENKNQGENLNGACLGDSDTEDKDSEPEKHDKETKEKEKEMTMSDIEALLYRRHYNTNSFST